MEYWFKQGQVRHPNLTKFHFPFKSHAFVIVRKVCLFPTICNIGVFF